MRKISGVVKSREEKSGAKGPFCRVSVGGEFFNVFPHQDFYEIPLVGRPVKVMLEPQEGTNYWNVAGVKIMEPDEVAKIAPAATGAPSGGFGGNEGMIWGACGHDACVLIAAQIVAGELKGMTSDDLVTKQVEVQRGLFKEHP